MSNTIMSHASVESGPPPVSAQGTRLEVKRIDKARNPGTGEWALYNSAPSASTGKNDQYAEYTEYAFVLQRKVSRVFGSDIPKITTKVIIQSDLLLRVTKDVLEDVQSISWNVQPLKVKTDVLLAFLPRFRAYLADQPSKSTPNDEDRIAEHLSFMIKFLETEYAATLHKIDSLVSHGEITFDLLWAIFLTRSVIFTSCKITSEPRAGRLREISRGFERDGTPYWRLMCEYVDANEDFAFLGQQFGLATIDFEIPKFDGVSKIAELLAYPIQWHPNGDELRAKLITRGRKWAGLIGVHNMHYNGVAYRKTSNGYSKVNVNGRIMIDRHTFANSDPDYELQGALRSLTGQTLNRYGLDGRKPGGSALTPGQSQDLSDDHVFFAPPIVYGFSLVDKRWLELNVEAVSPIRWNDEVFRNLVINPDQKLLVRSLVESHAQDQSFDDFVEGKGRGIVINLFGPPGVGKSLTVEAMSEHLCKPLYVVGAGDLGTSASTLNAGLTKIFAMASAWSAVIVIDEADVFLEERSSFDLERNAMVAVFLRQIEYFPGILFLTTNRVKQFDQAFQSRIHLSLRYSNLTPAAKERIWTAFIEKARSNPLGVQSLSPEEMRTLSEKEFNGRQIKNVVKLALSLANYDKEALGFRHLLRAINAMDDFNL